MSQDYQYNENYLAWKGWNRESFGHIGHEERNWFSAQLEDLNLTALSAVPHVLEIGFGNGQFLSYCREKGWSVLGVEVNDQLLLAARASGFEAIAHKKMDELPTNGFDLVVAFNVLEHIPLNELPMFLENIQRILKPGACFVSRFPNGDSPFGLRDQHGDLSHCTVLGSIRAVILMRNARFDIIRTGGEIEPLQGQSIRSRVRRVVSRILRQAISLIVSQFISRGNVHFAESNLLMICRKREECV